MQSLTCTETAPHWPTNIAPLLDWWSSRSPALKNGSKTLQPTATDSRCAALEVKSFLFFSFVKQLWPISKFICYRYLNATLNAVITIRRSLQQTFNSSISKGSDQELGEKKKKNYISKRWTTFLTEQTRIILLDSFRPSRWNWSPSLRGVGVCDPAAPRSPPGRLGRNGAASRAWGLEVAFLFGPLKPKRFRFSWR